MTQSHTPGPWRIRQSVGVYEIFGNRENPHFVCAIDKITNNATANAYLIAAALDYDKAVELVINVLENDKQVIHAKQYELESECEKCQALSALYAAQEKARGQ